MKLPDTGFYTGELFKKLLTYQLKLIDSYLQKKPEILNAGFALTDCHTLKMLTF